MSLLGSMLGKVFPASKWAPPPAAANQSPQPASTAPPPAASVDVEAVLTRMEQSKRQRLDWRH